MAKVRDKLQEAISNLEHALEFEDKAKKDAFFAAGLSKSFETCLEYAWKHFRDLVRSQGIEVYGPKDSIKQAGRLGLIDNVEEWLDFINDRNLAVHDYIGINNKDYLNTIKQFAKEVKKIIKR